MVVEISVTKDEPDNVATLDQKQDMIINNSTSYYARTCREIAVSGL